MEVNKTEIEEIIHTKGNNIIPRPIPERNCECGCGNLFYPRRRDNIYLNKQHADFAYNHGKRKAKNQNKVKSEKILLKNDNILNRHFNSDKNSKHVDRHLDILVADGFNLAYNIGKHEENGIGYNYTYNFYYSIFFVKNIKMAKIFKQ